VPVRQTSAYALRTYALSEADQIVLFYTLDFGRLRSVAKGARRLKSRFGSSFQTLTRSSLSFFEREGQELTRVSACEVEQSYYDVLLTPEAAATAAYFAELVQEFTAERDANPAIFRLMGAVMEGVSEGVSLAVAARYFEVWMLRLSGVLPRLNECGGCGQQLSAERWVVPDPLEFICRQCRVAHSGSRWLSPSGTALLTEILRKPPMEVMHGTGQNRQAVQRLAAVNRLLIRGQLDKELRTVRYLDRLRHAGRRPPLRGPRRVEIPHGTSGETQ
jgi:DNA repair protein RecO (recombination protein O)